jgi:hypothetical protein
VCRVGDEGALLVEGALETLERTFEGMRERGQFGGLARGGGGMEGPRVRGDFAGKGCEFAQRCESAVENPGDERTGDEDEEKHAGGVELDGAVDGVPDVFSR